MMGDLTGEACVVLGSLCRWGVAGSPAPGLVASSQRQSTPLNFPTTSAFPLPVLIARFLACPHQGVSFLRTQASLFPTAGMWQAPVTVKAVVADVY